MVGVFRSLSTSIQVDLYRPERLSFYVTDIKKTGRYHTNMFTLCVHTCIHYFVPRCWDVVALPQAAATGYLLGTYLLSCPARHRMIDYINLFLLPLLQHIFFSLMTHLFSTHDEGTPLEKGTFLINLSLKEKERAKIMRRFIFFTLWIIIGASTSLHHYQ